MKRFVVVLLLSLSALAAQADGMRCGNALITRGDNVLRVQHECGEPTYASQFTIYGTRPVFNPLLNLYAEVTIPITVEEWTYNLGPTRFMQRLRFENGELITIETLEYGY
jgi:hypothetical protein